MTKNEEAFIMTSKVSPVVSWLHCCELWVQQTIAVAEAHGGEFAHFLAANKQRQNHEGI